MMMTQTSTFECVGDRDCAHVMYSTVGRFRHTM
jgi:hypothetical protein